MKDRPTILDSEDTVRKLVSGKIPKGSIIRFYYPSGNSMAVRFHGFDKGKFVGCGMQWDNGATEFFDLHNCLIKQVEGV